MILCRDIKKSAEAQIQSSTIVSPTLCTAPGFIFPPSDLILIGNEKLPTTSIFFKQIHRFHAVLDNLDYQFDKIVCCLFQANTVIVFFINVIKLLYTTCVNLDSPVFSKDNDI
ncbi:hypothetical protein AB4K20DRAFT_1869190 [Rhizopus microsporus]|uniref:Uncharacterized protein n=1 Tax=Rhizopus microsporus TaxID=58291 RepID=A0A1X0S6A4_RHIZD|nr:hypothetical protein BCV71DRAFT_233865 [Rhizopus microsporus]